MKMDTTVILTNEQVIVLLDALTDYEGNYDRRQSDADTYASLPGLSESLTTPDGLRSLSESIRRQASPVQQTRRL